jgi:VanZ family protein
MPNMFLNAGRVFNAALAVAVAGLIAWGCLQPHNPIPNMFPKQDKFEHLIAFGLFAATLAYALPRRFAPAAVLGTALLAVAVEFGQKFWVPTREFSYTDAAAGIIGAVVAGALIMALFAWQERFGDVSVRDQ